VILVVVAGAFGGTPHPGLHGKSIGVTLALCVFVYTLALAIRGRFTARDYAFQAAVISAMGAAGVALVALQPKGATELAGGAAVWMAVARLPLVLGVAVGVGITVADDVAAVLSGSSSAAVFAATLLSVLLGLVAYFLKEARASQDRTELLLAQLEDAREEQTRAAAIAERGRIASELHDVLAHSLSGAAIQLQGARKLAERDAATPQIRSAIDRASELVKDGLLNARQAVGALRVAVRELDVDFLICATYKWTLGPLGLAFFYCKAELLDRLQLQRWGWMQAVKSDAEGRPTRLQTDARKFEYGTLPFQAFVELHASLQFLNELGQERVETRIFALNERLHVGLRSIDADVWTPADNRSGMLTIHNLDARRIGEALERERIIITPRPAPRNQIRISANFYNTDAEIDRCLAALARLL